MEFAFHALVFFVLGIALFYADTKVGIKWYRSWYNLTHKDPMADEVTMGFIYNRSFQIKAILALVLVGIEVGISFFWGSAGSLNDLLYGVGELVGIIIGFILAPRMIKTVPGKVKGAIDYMEKVDKGEVNLKKDIVKGAIKAGSEIKDVLSETDNPKPEPKQEVKPEPTPEPEQKAVEPEKKEESEEKKDDDWRKGVKKFLDK